MPNQTSNPTPKIILGFDFGMKYIGIAVGQTITQTASPLTTLNAKDGIPHWPDIQKLIEQWRVTDLVVGIPLNMDNTTQLMTFRARRFMKRLTTQFKLPTHEVDERLSSWEVKERGTFAFKNGKPNLQSHAEAAVILVEQWMRDHSKPSNEDTFTV